MNKAIFQAYDRYGRWLPIAFSALFVILLGGELARLTWALAPTPARAAWQPAPARPVTPVASTTGSAPLDAILRAELFGRYDPVLAVPDPTQVVDTRLNLTLIGIFASSEDAGSRALIADSSGKQEPYAVGDDIDRGTTVQAIFADRVILARDGRLEALRLDKDKPGASSASYSAPPPTAAQPSAAGDAGAVTPEQIAQIRQQILQDPAKASEFIRVQPSNAGGKLRGYRIYPGRDRSIFNAAGLKPGDLVTTVNGVQLDDPTKALQMLSDLSQATSFNLVVERAGQSQTINFTLN